MDCRISKLSPYVLDHFEHAIRTHDGQEKFILKLQRFLSAFGDDAAENDLVFATITELSSRSILEVLPITRLARLLTKLEESTRQSFLEGANPQLRYDLEKSAMLRSSVMTATEVKQRLREKRKFSVGDATVRVSTDTGALAKRRAKDLFEQRFARAVTGENLKRAIKKSNATRPKRSIQLRRRVAARKSGIVKKRSFFQAYARRFFNKKARSTFTSRHKGARWSACNLIECLAKASRNAIMPR